MTITQETTTPAEGPHAAAPMPDRDTLIRVEAYLRYERNGRLPGRELEDWLDAEREVDRMLALLIPVAAETGTVAPAPIAPKRRRAAAAATAADAPALEPRPIAPKRATVRRAAARSPAGR